MSNYEDYDRISRSYDRTRRPVGIDLILYCLARFGRPPDESTMLDAGCGTGAFTQALGEHLAHIHALDYSDGMLRAARAKNADAKADFLRGSIEALPLRDGAVDAILNNLVLHHLKDDADALFPVHRRVIGEFARVLKPGGVLVIGICTREQLASGFWFTHLIPQALAACARVTIPLELLNEMLQASGFEVRESLVPWDETLQGDAYFNALGPLERAWRDGDSIWTLSPPEELAAAMENIRQLDADGDLENFVESHDAARTTVGQITFVCAVRR
jgi:ubiquinone/menaquinone biosynthesis C-methylase UbiE